MDKLTQVKARSFQSGHLKISELLDACLPAVFPTQEYILNNLKGLTPKDKIFVSYYNKAFLPYHTRDAVWLARYFEQICDTYYVNNSRVPIKIQTSVKRLPIGYFQKYIETSEKFDALRCQYEHSLVRAYVILALNTDIDDFYMKSINKSVERCDPEYNYLFRKRVLDAMKHLGVDSYNAEIGIEICKNLWHDKVVAQTFANIYNMPNANKLLSADGLFAQKMPKKWKKLVNLEHVLYARWLTLYNNEYCCEHDDIIRRVGNNDHKYKLTPQEMKRLKSEVQGLGFEYECMLFDAQQYCDQFNKRKHSLDVEI